MSHKNLKKQAITKEELAILICNLRLSALGSASVQMDVNYYTFEGKKICRFYVDWALTEDRVAALDNDRRWVFTFPGHDSIRMPANWQKSRLTQLLDACQALYNKL